MSLFDKIKFDKNGKVDFIVALFFDYPNVNQDKMPTQNKIINEAKEKGHEITTRTRIHFDSFYDNSYFQDDSYVENKANALAGANGVKKLKSYKGSLKKEGIPGLAAGKPFVKYFVYLE